MVVSVNPGPSISEFKCLIENTLMELNARACKSPDEISPLKGKKLEPYIVDLMSDFAKGTPFENTIELVSGQKFPDIVANKYYGIEVKTTTQNHWKTTGNSVLESSRINGVERIFMLFGKLREPMEFRCRPYEECLSEVVVTHSPRYLIDMNLKKGKTIFDKINISYDNLRKMKNPIKSVTDYYKRKLKPGQDLWWIDQNNEEASKFVINIWANLKKDEKKELFNKAMVFFPEIFSNDPKKYTRLAVWLVTRHGVVCPNIRDLFSAGGREEIEVNSLSMKNVPKIYVNLINNIDSVIVTLVESSEIELSEYWNEKVFETNKIMKWIELVSRYSKTFSGTNHFDLRKILEEIMKDRL